MYKKTIVLLVVVVSVFVGIGMYIYYDGTELIATGEIDSVEGGTVYVAIEDDIVEMGSRGVSMDEYVGGGIVEITYKEYSYRDVVEVKDVEKLRLDSVMGGFEYQDVKVMEIGDGYLEVKLIGSGELKTIGEVEGLELSEGDRFRLTEGMVKDD